MTEKMSPQQIENAAHEHAYSLLGKIIEFQPNLLSIGSGNIRFLNEDAGKDAGLFLAGLYDQLVAINRKWIQAECDD